MFPAEPRIVGNPVEDYVPTVYISAAINFLSVALVQGICSARADAKAAETGAALSIDSVRGLVLVASGAEETKWMDISPNKNR